MNTLSYKQLGILASALVIYRDYLKESMNNAWSGMQAMQESTAKEAFDTVQLLDEIQKADAVILDNNTVEEPPLQYWAIVIPAYQTTNSKMRVIAPFFSESDAEEHAKKHKLAPYYVVCTENSCDTGSKSEPEYGPYESGNYEESV